MTLTDAVTVVVHRWKHPTYRVGEQGCRCRKDAEMAVDVALSEGLVAPSPTGARADGCTCPPVDGDEPHLPGCPAGVAPSPDALRAALEYALQRQVDLGTFSALRADEIIGDVYAALAPQERKA